MIWCLAAGMIVLRAMGDACTQGHMQNLSERELTSLLGYNVMPGATLR